MGRTKASVDGVMKMVFDLKTSDVKGVMKMRARVRLKAFEVDLDLSRV